MSFPPFRKKKRVKISVRTGLTSSEIVPVITPKKEETIYRPTTFRPYFNLKETYEYLQHDKSTGGTSG